MLKQKDTKLQIKTWKGHQSNIRKYNFLQNRLVQKLPFYADIRSKYIKVLKKIYNYNLQIMKKQNQKVILKL